MILQNLLSDDGTNSENGNFSKLEKYYIIQGSKRVPTELLKEELSNATRGLSKIAPYEIVGGIRRKNMFVEDITILIAGNSETTKKIYEKYKLVSLDKRNNKCFKLVTVGNRIISENYIIVNPKYFGVNCIKYTGSHQFVKMLEERANSLGFDLYSIKAESEKDVFDILKIPYIEPECRECRYDIRLPITETLLSSIPSLDISDCIVSFKDFVINGKKYVESLRNENQRIGIQLDCLSQYDKKQMDCFDFVVASFYLTNQTSLVFTKYLSNVDKPLIIKGFGTDLSIPLRIINSRADWTKEFKGMVRHNVIIQVNSGKENLHPSLLNLYQKLGGKFILENTTEALELSRKALLPKSSIINDNYRFEKLGV